MKAAMFHGPHQPLTIENVDIDKPAGREVLVRVVASGVCHSDLHFVDGLYPLPRARHPRPRGGGDRRGGRLAGLGVHAGRPRHRLPLRLLRPLRLLPHRQDAPLPDRGPSAARTSRPSCRWKGQPVNQFANLSAYAEKMLVHENALVKIDDDMPLDRAALIGCGVTTGVGAVLNTARIEAGSAVAVFGAGGVGLAAIQGARIGGARMIIAVDVVESQARHRARSWARPTPSMRRRAIRSRPSAS